MAEEKKMPLSVKFAFFILFVSAFVFAPLTFVFVVCMVPTFAAALSDRQKEKTLWLTVGSLNLAGTVPAWFLLWDRGGRMADALAVASDVGVLLLAYGAAACGWVIHMNVTPLVAALVVRRKEARLREIDKQQKELVRKWGPDIAGNP